MQACAHCSAQMPEDLKAELRHACPLVSSGRSPLGQEAALECIEPQADAAAAVAHLSTGARACPSLPDLRSRPTTHAVVLQAPRPLVAIAFAQNACEALADAALMTLARCADTEAWSARLRSMGCVAIWDSSQPEAAQALCVAESEVTCLAGGPEVGCPLLIGGASDGSLCCWDLQAAPNDRAELAHGACDVRLPCQHVRPEEELGGAAALQAAGPVASLRTCGLAKNAETRSTFQVLVLHEGGRVDVWTVRSHGSKRGDLGMRSESGASCAHRCTHRDCLKPRSLRTA